MQTMLVLPIALLLAHSVPALAQNPNNNGNHGQGTTAIMAKATGGNGGYRGAPGPIVGAGLPLLLIGGGIYWIVRRRKNAA